MKPANILLASFSGGDLYSGEPEVVKVTDFGISRRLLDSTLTEHNAVMGTAPYLSPEQAMGRSADHRSDLYSLGVVLYEMLAGERPFEAGEDEGPLAVAMKHVNESPAPPSSVNPGVPPALDELTLRLLGKDPEERPESASGLVAALETETRPEPGTGLDKGRQEEGYERHRQGGRGVSGRRRLRRYAAPAIVALLFVALTAGVGATGALPGLIGDKGGRQSVPVPDLRGASLEEARSLADGEVEIAVTDRRAHEAPEGIVLSVEPESGRRVQRGSEVRVVLSEEPREEQAGSGQQVRPAVRDYYEAVDRRDWSYTYDHLDDRSQRMFTREEWYRKNQHLDEADQLSLSTMKVEVLHLSESGDYARVNVYRTFDSGYEIDRNTVFVYEGGSWRHRLVGEELVFFMPDTSIEEF